MKRIVALAVSLAACAPALAQPGLPEGWKLGGTNAAGYEAGTAATDGMEGKQAAYIKPRKDNTASRTYGNLMQSFRAEAYRGKYVRFTARMKGQDVLRMQLWMGMADAGGKTVRFYDQVGFFGTADWSRYEIVLTVPQNAETISFGALVGGATGTGWIDSARFETVDKETGAQAVKTQVERRRRFINRGPPNWDEQPSPFPTADCCK